MTERLPGNPATQAFATISATSGEVTIRSVGTTTITATKAADTDYNAATASYTLNIAKADQAEFDFANVVVDKTFGDPVFTFTPTGGSGAGAITYESSDREVATVSTPSGEVTIVGIGEPTITAIKAADDTYNAATASYILNIAKADQAEFDFASTTVYKTVGDPVFTFTPTGGSGTGVITYESSKTEVASVSTLNGEVTIGSVGTTTITATKAGDATYNEGTATYTLTVKADQVTFTFADDAVDKTFGDPVFTFTPTGGLQAPERLPTNPATQQSPPYPPPAEK